MKTKKDNNEVSENSLLIPHYADPIANAELSQKEYEDGLVRLSTLPPIVTFSLTTHCFKKDPCLICDRNTRHPSSDSEIDVTVISAVKPLLETAEIVFLHSGGEAMFSPYFDEVITSIKPPTKIRFSTNGMALTNDRANLMLQSGVMANISISMDAATPKLYRVMRPSCDYKTVKKNLLYYGIRGKELFGNDAPGFILNMTLCEANIKDAPQFVDLAKELGAKGVIFGHLNSGLSHKVKTCEGWIWDYKEQENFNSKEQHDDIILAAYHRAKNNKVKVAFIGKPFLTKDMAMENKEIISDLSNFNWIVPKDIWTREWHSSVHNSLNSELKPCLKPWQEIAIQPNGNIRRCCFHDEQLWTMGNICEADFMDIWNSEDMIKYREEFLNNSMSHICFASTPCVHRGRQ